MSRSVAIDPESPRDYGLREVASLSGLSPSRVRAYARAGLIEPLQVNRGTLRFSFRDLVFLRRVKGVGDATIAPRRMRRALERLRAQLPRERHLAGVTLAAEAGQVVAREGDKFWSPESGQCLLDFGNASPSDSVVAFPTAAWAEPCPGEAGELDTNDWYSLACELESTDPERARESYRQALEVDPRNLAARVNLGCLCHEAGELEEAEAHYRAALEIEPADPTAAFNRAVALDDLGRLESAREAYEIALASDANCADAHFNLARVCDRLGDEAGLLRHLGAYRRLTRDD